MHVSQPPFGRIPCTNRFDDPCRTYRCRANLSSQLRSDKLALWIRGGRRVAFIGLRPLREQPCRIEDEGEFGHDMNESREQRIEESD